jgi:ABC-type dipeptide/oligopeptide/nickel transport system permease subunit
MPEGVRIVIVLAVAALVVLVIYGVIAGLMLGFRNRKDRTR